MFKQNTDLFHPKLYLFTSDDKIALFIGSSNLTYSGFYCNVETNVLLEGSLDNPEQKTQVGNLLGQLEEWRSDAFSFVPSEEWIIEYSKAYYEALANEKKYGIKARSGSEDEIPFASWVRDATWATYYGKVLDGLKEHDRNAKEYPQVLRRAAEILPRPWTTIYFDDLEVRRVIGGLGVYGWFGHVGASGKFLRLLKYGSEVQKTTIAEVVNTIAPLDPPMDWDYLLALLEKLVSLRPTMKVWGRPLCLVRPDLYCSVASPSVRTNLSRALDIPQSSFQSADGYVKLIQLLHSSPWFQSPEPKDEEESEVWRARVAFMDAIFYSGSGPAVNS